MPSSGSLDVERREGQGDVGEELLAVILRLAGLLPAEHPRLRALPEDLGERLPHRGEGVGLRHHYERCEARRHAEAQDALNEDAHGLNVDPCDHGVRPRRLIEAADELVLAPHGILELTALRLQLLVPLFAVLEVADDIAALAALLLEVLGGGLEHHHAPQRVPVLVVEVLELPAGHRHDVVRHLLVGLHKLGLGAPGQDHDHRREVLRVDEVIVSVALHLDDIGRQHVDQIAVGQIRALLLGHVAALRLEVVVLRRLVPRLLIELVDDGHEERQIVEDGTGLRVLGFVPLPRPQVVMEGLLLPLRLHTELGLRVQLEVLTLKAMQDGVNLGVALLQVVRQADEVVEGAKEQGAVAVRHIKLEGALERALRAGARAERRVALERRQEALLLRVVALLLGATHGHDPELLADAHGLKRGRGFGARRRRGEAALSARNCTAC
mmetsp:Transcript_13198/g.38005  ORF Transcript_13198/g.38005 Transcript_13198/m.38005 type:complete len:440 (+) Transcript_13198:133-1452(+)